MKTFLGISSMTALVALSLTPELSTGLAILVAAFFSGMTAMLTALYTARTARIVATQEMTKALAPVVAMVAMVPAVAKKLDEIAPVVAKIDGHVNSEKTKAEGEIAAKDIEINLQREVIEELKKAAALMAQAKATTDVAAIVAQAVATGVAAPVMAPSPVSAPSASPVLKRIETNTAQTAENTKKTDENVQALKDQA